MKLTATPQQQAFIDRLLNGAGHLVLRARAGCGKTSTILMAVQAYGEANPGAEVVVCAYNKAIANEVSEKLAALGFKSTDGDNGRRVPPRVVAKTIHSLGLDLVRFMFKPEIKESKVRDLVRGSNSRVCREYEGQVIDLVKYAKQAGFGFFSDCPIEGVQAWYDLADHFDVNGLDDTTEMAEIVAAAQEIYRQSLNLTGVMDFDDMILFPLIKNVRVKWPKDLVIVDEAQDLSRTRQALARKFVRPGTGRMVIVGDDRQAIYGFSGADAAALDNLTSMLGAEVMPLSVTWRCPKAVVALAQRLVPDIEAAEGAPEGRVEVTDGMVADLGAGDAVLCRNTAPLITEAYRLIRSGVAARVEGRGIGDGLKNLVTRWKIKTIAQLLARLEDYQAREQQKAQAKGNEQKAEEVADRCETLRQIVGAVAEKGGREVTDVIEYIDRLFADTKEGEKFRGVTLATYHRSKGREWDRVVLLQHSSRCPSPWARQTWQKVQEENLAYVAITRAKQTLVFAG